jgi:hypothetical protein
MMISPQRRKGAKKGAKGIKAAFGGKRFFFAFSFASLRLCGELIVRHRNAP